jgi:hypothetical protein
MLRAEHWNRWEYFVALQPEADRHKPMMYLFRLVTLPLFLWVFERNKHVLSIHLVMRFRYTRYQGMYRIQALELRKSETISDSNFRTLLCPHLSYFSPYTGWNNVWTQERFWTEGISVTVDERGGLRLIDYLRWAELHIYMAVHELSLTCTRPSGQGPNRYNIE